MQYLQGERSQEISLGEQLWVGMVSNPNCPYFCVDRWLVLKYKVESLGTWVYFQLCYKVTR